MPTFCSWYWSIKVVNGWPLFRVVAETKLREIFTALTLSLVMGIALLMEAVGLSAALGTFIAGVVLADNEYRHELEAEIEPFKGLLLGVFFISVGASIDFSVMMQQPYVIAGLVCLLVLVKLVVLFSFASSNAILPATIIAPLVVALSMAFAPLLMIVNDKIIQPLFTKKASAAPEADVVDDGKTQVIIAGFGRFGQIIDRSLNLSDISTTVMQNNPSQVQQLRKFGHKVFYGDMSRRDLLHSAGADIAELLVIAINDHEQTKTIISICKKHYPKLKLYARAVGRAEAH
jgi:hypothetical protein